MNILDIHGRVEQMMNNAALRTPTTLRELADECLRQAKAIEDARAIDLTTLSHVAPNLHAILHCEPPKNAAETRARAVEELADLLARSPGGSEEKIPGKLQESVLATGVILPDGSGAFTASLPLPKTHWLYADHDNDPPMPMRVGVGPKRNELADQVKAAARYAIRASTMNGKETDFDPDAMVQNMIVGLLGCWTHDGKPGGRLEDR